MSYNKDSSDNYSSQSSDIEFRIDNNPFSVNNKKAILNSNGNNTNPVLQSHIRYIERICTRAIKFMKITKEIIVDSESYHASNEQSKDDSSEFSQLTYSNSCDNVYIDSIEFTEGANGTINYAGCIDSKPDLSVNDFTIRIPSKVSAFIIKTTVSMGDSNIKAHWWIDLKSRNALPLSFLKNGKNPCLNGCFKNTSATVVACNSHILPCQFNTNKSNLYYSMTDKDSNVSPYNIYLFSSNIC